MAPPLPHAHPKPAPARRKLGAGPIALVLFALAFPEAARGQSTFPDSLLGSAQGDSITVAGAVARAREYAPSVQAALAELAAARSDSAAARTNHWPSFFFRSGATVAPPGFYDPTVTDLGQYQIQLGMEVSLLNGGALARERLRAVLEAQAASAEVRVASREAGLRAAEAALDLVRQSAQQGVEREALDWLDRLHALLQSQVRAGAHGKADLVRIEVERDAAMSSLLQAIQEQEALRRELAELTALPQLAGVRLIVPEAEFELPPSPADSLALLELRRLSATTRQSEIEVRQREVALQEARRANALSLQLSADAGLWGADLSAAVPDDLKAEDPDATFGDRLKRDLGASTSFELRKPIFNPSAAHTIRAREASLRAANLRLEAARARNAREALDALGQWRAGATRLTLARHSVELARENLLRLRSLYLGGSASLLELLDARRELVEAASRLADARFDARLARFQAEVP